MKANKNVSAHGSSDAHEVQIETFPAESCEREETVKSLKSIIAQSREVVGPCEHRRLQKVPELLRKNKEKSKPFDPVIIAIGPYHHSDPRLAGMEDHKKAATYDFAGAKVDVFYDKVAAVTQEAKKLYVDELLPTMKESDFTLMLLFDGCFVLHFINQFVNGNPEKLSISSHLHGFILRDMFLLENQIPYVVLEALMSEKTVEIDKFLDLIVGTEFRGSGGGSATPDTKEVPELEKHAHLLAHLRQKHLGKKDNKTDLVWVAGNPWRSFRSATELSRVGINFGPSSSRHMRDVRFEPFFLWGKLTLPKMVVDDLTRSRLLNMVALEMCPGAASDYGITSFVWLLDCLIDHADDVKELRKKGILLNALGSDEQVAELFNEIATDLAPDQQAYMHVLDKITSHFKSKTKVSIYHLIDTHFSSPWTAISFFAAVVLLILTLLQTIYTILG